MANGDVPPVPATEELLRHAGFVRAIAFSLLKDADRADDVVQDTYVEALRRKPAGPALGGWLASVARRISINRWRSEQRRARRERAASSPAALPSPDEAAARLETHRRVVDAVMALDEPYRSTVVYRFFYGLQIKDIAARLDVPVETVRTRLRRALHKLRAALAPKRRGGLALVLAPLMRDATAVGGVVVGTKAKLALVAVLLLALLATIGFRMRSDEPAKRSTSTTAREPVIAPDKDEKAPEPPPPAPIDRARDVHGEVVDVAGKPVAGARVTAILVAARSSWFPQSETEGPTCVSDAEGRFRLRLDPGDLVDVRVTADGFAPHQHGMIQAGERVRVVLTRPVGLDVLVLDSEGAPAPDVRVSAASWRQRGGLVFEVVANTNEAGKCVLPGLPASAPASVRADHPTEGVAHLYTSTPEHGAEAVTMHLPGARPLRGIVRDRATGAPIAAARIRISRQELFSDASGRFEVYMARNTRFTAHVDAAGYVPRWVQVWQTDVVAEMAAGVEVRGALVDADGSAVPGAPFQILSYDGSWPEFDVASGQEGRSRADGTFAVNVDASATVHTLAVLAPGHGRKHLDFEAPEARDLGRIVLPPARTLAGRVVDANGQPVARAKIQARGSNRDRARLWHGRRAPPRMAHDAYDTRYTDDLGRFRFSGLPPGVYVLWLEPSNRRAVHETHELPEDSDLLDVEVRLPAVRTFRVTVVDSEGKPCGGVFVAARAGGGTINGYTDAKGEAVLLVSEAIAEVHCSPPAGHQSPPARKVQPHEDAIRIVLTSAGKIAGTLVGPDGEPLRVRAIIGVHRDGKRIGTVNVAADGTFHGKVPVDGSVDLVLTGEVSAAGTMVTTITQEQFFYTGELRGVRAGMEQLVLRAEPVTFDRSLRVRVVTPAGEPVAGARVRVYPVRDEKGYEIVTTDASGIAEFTGLPSREVVVTYAGRPRRSQLGLAPPAERERRVEPNGQEVTLGLRATVPVRGVVALPDGTPAVTQISVFADDQWVQQAVTAQDGRFEVRVPPDAKKITVQGTARRRVDGKVCTYAGYVVVKQLDVEVQLKLELQQ